MRLQGIKKTLFLIIFTFASTLTVSKANRRSIRNDNETPGISKIQETRSITENDRGLSLAENKRENSPALDSFLKNVLRAQDELKWIDEAVRKAGTKETREKIPSRYLRSSFRPVSRYRTKMRFKRRSIRHPDDNDDDDDLWLSSKRRYNYDDDDLREDELYKRKQRRSAVDDGLPLDDSVLKKWAMEEGLQVPGSWFESGKIDPSNNWSSRNYADEKLGNNRRSSRMDDFSKSMNNWVEGPSRGERDADKSIRRKEIGEEPSLESLKKTVLELRKTLENSDKKNQRVNEKEKSSNFAKNRERHVESKEKNNDDVVPRDKKQSNSGYEENDGEYRFESSPSKILEISPESNWWDDPRSAAEMFDFKRREDDDEDDENDDEEGERYNWEFDKMMRRVKREKDDEEEDDDDDGDEEKDRIRVYRRAGFGESYRDGGNLKNLITKEAVDEINKDSKELEPALDKVINDGNFDKVKNVQINGISDGNVNKNVQEIKNMGYDNPVKKSFPSTTNQENVLGEKTTGTIGDSNLKDTKEPGFISGDEKRSLSPRVDLKEEKKEKPKSIKSKLLDETLRDSLPDNNFIDKKEVDKSDPNNDDVHKFSKNSNQIKKHEDEQEEKKNHVTGSEVGQDYLIKVNEAELVEDNPFEKMKNQSANEGDKMKPRELNNSIDEMDYNKNFEQKIAIPDFIDRLKINSDFERDANDKNLKTVDNTELKNDTRKMPKDDDKIKSENRKDGKSGDKEILANNSIESVEKKLFTDDKKIEELDLRNLDLNNMKRKLLWLTENTKNVKNHEAKRDGNGTRFARDNRINFGSRELIKKRNAIRSIKKESVPDPCEESDFSSNDEKSKQVDKRTIGSQSKNVENEKENFRKRSLEKKLESQISEDEYEGDEDDDEDGAARNDEESNENDDGEENQSVESDGQSQPSPMHSLSHLDKERDPMRDRINVLIKQKLDDRGKEKSTNVKREANYEIANIQYYDYEDDAANGGDSYGDSKIAENEQRIPDQKNSTSFERSVSFDQTPLETIPKKDESTADEKRQEAQQEQQTKPPKQEFISDVDLENSRQEKGSKSISDETINEERESDAVRSNNRWLAQPGEADEDSKNRYEEMRDTEYHEKNFENERSEDSQEPLEYSVNVHGKLDPDLTDNEKRNENLRRRENDDWRYEKISDKSRSQNDEIMENEEFDKDDAAAAAAAQNSGRNWRYRDSARIEEGNNDRELSPNYSYSHENVDEDEEEEEEEEKEGEADDRAEKSRGKVRLTEDLNKDSLPTMLDRSETRGVTSGERTYLVIAPPKLNTENKTETENISSTSGSNYLALKITDDMFKGGIEQSNPIDDINVENNLLGETTTEWKIIDIANNPKTKFKSLTNNEKLKSSNKNLAINRRDVVHESIVDPEEMVGDFDDDTRPRFGRDLKYIRRSLQSVSYAVDPFERVHREVDLNGEEKPFEKYLENGQMDFKNLSDKVEIGKREDDKNSVDEKKPPIKSDGGNSTRLIKGLKNYEKRFLDGIESQANGTNKEKDKRGSTNVEEWEFNTPTIQKQGSISAIKSDKDSLQDSLEKMDSQTKSISQIFSNIDENTSSESHEREIRSVKLKDENSKSYGLIGEDFKSENKGESFENGENLKSLNKFRPSNSDYFSKYDDSTWQRNLRDNYDGEGGAKSGENYENDWKRVNRDKNIEEKKDASHDHKSSRTRHHLNSKKHGDKILGSGDEIRSHRNREFPVYSNDTKTSLKSVKRHKERNFKDSGRNPITQHAKSHDKITAGIMGHPHSMLRGKSFESGEGYDEGNAKPERDEKKVSNENTTTEVVPAKVIPELEDPQKKKFTVLLAADNMDDESQMDLALHGELAGKIVERIFDQVQKNDALKMALGPGLYRKHKSEDAVTSDRIYRQGLDEDEVKHTEGMMRRVMELLGRLILDEVQRKTCASLPPDMREFLQWMLGVDDDDKPTDQAPPLPLVHDSDQPERHEDDKFLFEGSPSSSSSSGHRYENPANADIDDLYRKVRVMRSLITEYISLSEQEKTRVQSVHDYLEKQLNLLLKYIETKESERGNNDQSSSPGGSENILQYQNAAPPNASETSTTGSTLSPLVNTPSILRLSNASFCEHPRATNEFHRFRRHGIRSELEDENEEDESSVETRKHKKKKHRKEKNENLEKHGGHNNKHGHDQENKKNKKKKNKNHEHNKFKRGSQSPEYKKLIRRAAMLRKKRANLYDDNWNPVDSGYEEPTIYNSNGEIRKKRKTSPQENRSNNFQDKENDNFWADALTGKITGDQDFDDSVDKLNSNEVADLDIRDTNNTTNKTRRDDKIKRDVLTASVALQPWLNTKSNDLLSSNYIKQLTNELVHGSKVPPLHPAAGNNKINGKEKRDVENKIQRNLADDEVILLNKREAWKTQNEQQLEEVAFGKDMRGKWKEKEQFEKLTAIDKKKNTDVDNDRKKREQDVKKVVRKTEDNMGKINETILKNDDSKKNETKKKVDILKNVEKIKNLDLGVFDGNKKKRDLDKNMKIEGGSAILPLMEVSEQREQQKQAAKTEKDDQRDIADQMLGYESRSLNTY